MSDSGPAFDGNPWEIARALHEKGTPRADIVAELTRRGLDEESVKVVLNTLPGAPTPSALPEARFDMATNALAPKLFAVADLGIEGDRRTVALYWLTFGLFFGVLTTGALLLGWANVFESSSSPWGQFAIRALPWIGYPLSVLALVRAFLLRR